MKRPPINIFLTGLMMMVCWAAVAQKTVLDEHGEDNLENGNYGPNRLHYVNFYNGFGFATDDGAEPYLPTKTFRSGYFLMGASYKLRLFEYLAIGMDAHYMLQHYHITQRSDKLFPTVGEQGKEGIRLGKVNMGPFLRINFTNRGDIIGPHIDLGMYGSLNVSSLHRIRNTFDDPNNFGSNKQVIKNRGLQYVERLGYGARVQIFFGNLAVSGFYRLSDAFIPEINQPDLPRLRFGLTFLTES